VAQNANGRSSAIDGGTTRHAGYAVSQRIRKRIEEAFGWIKTIADQERTKFRGCARVGWAFTLAAAAYNLDASKNLWANQGWIDSMGHRAVGARTWSSIWTIGWRNCRPRATVWSACRRWLISRCFAWRSKPPFRAPIDRRAAGRPRSRICPRLDWLSLGGLRGR
jgi:hypothetical protein